MSEKVSGEVTIRRQDLYDVSISMLLLGYPGNFPMQNLFLVIMLAN